MDVTFKLEVFEGPLDLLLHLISKNKVSILDIPIALIADQYEEYLFQMEQHDMEISTEFVQMAAELLLIKSRMLLPRENEDEDDPRSELREKLMELQTVKDAAETLAKTQHSANVLFFKSPQPISAELFRRPNQPIPLQKLLYAFSNILERQLLNAPPPRASFEGIVGREPVSVHDKSLELLEKLENQVLKFEEIFVGASHKRELVAIFLALLEMMKLGNVFVFFEDEQLYIKRGSEVITDFEVEIE